MLFSNVVLIREMLWGRLRVATTEKAENGPCPHRLSSHEQRLALRSGPHIFQGKYKTCLLFAKCGLVHTYVND